MRLFKNQYLRIALSFIVLSLFCYYFIYNKDKFKPILDLNPLLLIGTSLIYSLIVVINGLFTKIIIEPFNVFITINEGIFLAIISSIGNFFAPAGAGYGLRAIYLKKKYNLSYTNYTVTLAGYYVLLIMINSLAGILALILLRNNDNPSYKLILVSLVLAFLFSLIFSLFNLSENHLPKIKNTIYQKIVNVLVMISLGWKEISSNKKLILKLIGLIVISLALTMIMVSLIINSLHFTTSFAAVLLYSVLGLLSLFINVTPGNIGIKEGVILFSASVMGFSVSQVILIAIVERGIVFISLLYLWIIAERMKKQFI